MSSQVVGWNGSGAHYSQGGYSYPPQYLQPEQERWQPEIGTNYDFAAPPPVDPYRLQQRSPPAFRYPVADPLQQYAPDFDPQRYSDQSPIRYHEPIHMNNAGGGNPRAPSPHRYFEPVGHRMGRHPQFSEELAMKPPHARYMEGMGNSQVQYLETTPAPVKYSEPIIDQRYSPVHHYRDHAFASEEMHTMPSEADSRPRGQSVVRRMVLSREPLAGPEMVPPLSSSERWAATVASVTSVKPGMLVPHRNSPPPQELIFRPATHTFEDTHFPMPSRAESRSASSIAGLRRAPHMGTEANIQIPTNADLNGQQWGRPGRLGGDLILEPSVLGPRNRRPMTSNDLGAIPAPVIRPASAQLRPMQTRLLPSDWGYQPSTRALNTGSPPMDSDCAVNSGRDEVTPLTRIRATTAVGRSRSSRNASTTVGTVGVENRVRLEAVRACAVQQIPTVSGNDSARVDTSRTKSRTPKGSDKSPVMESGRVQSSNTTQRRGRAPEEESITTIESAPKTKSVPRRRAPAENGKNTEALDLASLLANVTGSLNEQQLPVLDKIRTAVNDLAEAYRTLALKGAVETQSPSSSTAKRAPEVSTSEESASTSNHSRGVADDPLANSKVIDELTNRVSQKVMTKVLASLLKTMTGDNESNQQSGADEAKERGRALSWTEQQQNQQQKGRSTDQCLNCQADAHSVASSSNKPDIHTYGGPFGSHPWPLQSYGGSHSFGYQSPPGSGEMAVFTPPTIAILDDGNKVRRNLTDTQPPTTIPPLSKSRPDDTAATRKDEKKTPSTVEPPSTKSRESGTETQVSAQRPPKAGMREVMFTLRIDTFQESSNSSASNSGGAPSGRQAWQPTTRQVDVVRINKNPDLFVLPDCFTAAECHHLIGELPLKWDVNPVPGVIVDAARKTDGLGRIVTSPPSSARAGSITTALLKKGSSPCVSRLERRLAAASQCRQEQINRIFLVKFSPGAYLGPHLEGHDIFKTILVFLNDLEGRGGDVAFTKLGLQVRPKRGTALMWQDELMDKEGNVKPNPAMIRCDRPTEHDEKILLVCQFRH